MSRAGVLEQQRCDCPLSPGPFNRSILCSAWCRSAHTRLIDPAISDALWTVTGCLRPTTAHNLPIIAASNLLSFVAMGPHCLQHAVPLEPLKHLLHSGLTRPSNADARHLKSKQPIVPAAQLISSSDDDNNRSAGLWTDHRWNAEWLDNTMRLCTFITDMSTNPTGMALPRTAWVRLNRLHTCVGRFRSCLYKWGMASSAACECGAEEQTVDHVVLQCPIHQPPHGAHGLMVLDDETIEWLLNTCTRSSAAYQWIERTAHMMKKKKQNEVRLRRIFELVNV